MTTLEMENVLKMPVDRKILWVEDVWDSICRQTESVPVPDSANVKLVDKRQTQTTNNEQVIFFI